MEEGKIVAWLKQPGDSFRRGDILLEVETDKTVVEVPALSGGVMLAHLAQPGESISIDQPIAEIDSEQDASPAVAITASTKRTQLTMPRLGETMEEGRIVLWRVAEGETYKRGDVLLEVETDKTVAEFPALADGRLLKYLAAPDEMVPVNAPIAEIEMADDGSAEPAATPQAAIPERAHPEAARIPARLTAKIVSDGRPPASPRARRLAAQNHIDLAGLTGTGRHGRVQGWDVLAHVSDATTASKAGKERSTTPTVLFLHGFAGDATLWQPMARVLGRNEIATQVLELPGHGDAPSGPTDPAMIAAHFAHEIEAAGQRVHIVGHSLGAAIAVLIAQKAPRLIAGLTLVAPYGLGRDVDQYFVDGMQRLDDIGTLEALLSRTTKTPLAYSPAVLQGMLKSLTRPAGLAYRRQMAPLLAKGGEQQFSVQAALQSLATPISLVIGHADRIVSFDALPTLPHRVAVHHFRSGHMPMLEFADDIAGILLDRTARR